MTAEEPLIDLFIQPAKHPYFVKEKSFWTVDRAASLAQRSRSCAQHSRSFACQLPSVGRSPPGDKPIDNGSLPSRLFSVSSDGVCAARVPPQAVIAADDRLRVAGSFSAPTVQAQQAAEHRSPWPQRCRGPQLLGGSGPSMTHETMAVSGEEGKELKHGAIAGEPRAAVATAAMTEAAGSSAETVEAATAASTSGSNNLAFLTESIRRKKSNRWRPQSPDNGRESIKLLSDRGSPLPTEGTRVVATTRGAFHNAGYDGWPDDEFVDVCCTPPYADVECATEASESSTGCAANARHETAAFLFRRPSTSSVETTGAPCTRDTVSLSGSSCHEDDIQPLSLVLHVADEPYLSGSDADCVVPGGGSCSTGVGLPSLTRRLFARHKRDGSGRSGSSSGGRTGGTPTRYHRDSGRSAAATVGGVVPSRLKPPASKSSRDAAGCGSDRTAANCCYDGDVAAILTPSATSSMSAASCWPTPPPQSLSPSFVPFSGSARTTLLRSRSRSPSSYSCSSSRLLSDRVATDTATVVGAIATPPRNLSYGSIDSFAYGMPPTQRAGSSSSWHQQRQQHQAESSFFDVVVAEPATVCSSRQAHLSTGHPGGSTAASSVAPAARQSIVLSNLEQFDFEEADEDFRGSRGSRGITPRKTQRRRRQRRVLIAVAVVLALTLAVGAVTAYLLVSGPQSSRGFSKQSSNGSTTSPTEHSILSTSLPNQAHYVGTILLKIEYTPDMADLRSATARNLTSHFCDAVKNTYSEHNLENVTYDSCEVTKLERGSVKVTFKITFTSKSRSSTLLNDNTTAKKLRLFLEDEIKTSKFGLFPCDVTNFSMELEHGESVQSQSPTASPRPGAATNGDGTFDRLVSEANWSTATGLSDNATIRRRFGLTPAHDSTATAAAATLPAIVATSDTPRVAQPLDSQAPMNGFHHATKSLTASSPSAAVTQAGFVATSAVAAPVTTVMQQLPEVTEQHLKWLRTEGAVAEQSTVEAVTSDREEASAVHVQTQPDSIAGVSAAPTFASPSTKKEGAVMTSEPSELLTSDLTSSALVDSGRQLSTQSVPTATLLPTVLTPDVFSPVAPAVVARTSGTPEPMSYDAVSADIVATAAATAASIESVLTITSATSIETTRAAFELLSDSQLTSPATYHIYERTSAHKHVTSVTSSGSSNDGFSSMSSVLPVLLYVSRTASEPDHTEHDAVSSMSPLPVQHASSATVRLHPSDDASAAPLVTSMRSTFADPVQAYGLATAGVSELNVVDEATRPSKVVSLPTSSRAVLDTVDASIRTQSVSSVTLKFGGTSVPIISTARPEVVTLPATSEPGPRRNNSGTSSTAATLSSVESLVLASQPAHGAYASITEERMAIASSTLTSSALAAQVASTALPNRLTADVTRGMPSSLATSTDVANARESLTTTFFVSSILPAAFTQNGSDSAVTPLPTSERVATDSAASTFDGSTALPALGSTSSAAESTSGAAIRNATSGASFGCGINESYMRPSPGNCLAYELCINGDLWNYSCVAGHYFNPLRNICDACNVLMCDKCPISRMERAGDGGTARAIAAAVPVGPEKGSFRMPSPAGGIFNGWSSGSAATATSMVDMATTIVTMLRLARTSPVPDFPSAPRPVTVTRSLLIGSAVPARPQHAAAGHISQALPEQNSPPPLHAAHHLTTAAVRSMAMPSLSTIPKVDAAATVVRGNMYRNTAVRTVPASSFVTRESSAERREFSSTAGSADQQHSFVAHASPCPGSQVVVADPDDCTAMIYCMNDGRVARETCENSEMFSSQEEMCVACDTTVCSKCVSST